MDIKVICPCGAKYQFPVQPARGALPHAIACPVCGADNTALGNEAIRVKLGAEPPSEYPPAAIPGGLRISQPAHTPQAAPPPLPPPPLARPMARPGGRATSASRPVQREKDGKAKKWLAAAGSAVLVLIGCWAIYKKVVKPVLGAVDLVQAIKEADAEWENLHWTLPDDNARVLLLKADNHTNVATALVQANTRLRRSQLMVQGATDLYDEDAQFYIGAPYNGVVEVQGFWDWEEAQVSNVAAAMSTQFQAQVVMALLGDDGESGVYAVFEEGERKFWMKRWYQITSLTEDGYKEFVQREGDDWAMARGFVPDPAELMETDRFAFQDANEFTLKLGIDLSDRPYEAANFLLLKPAGAAR